MKFRHYGRAGGLALIAVATIAALAACGSSGSSGSSGTPNGTPSSAGTRNNAFAAYVSCLGKNGVTISLPTGGGGNRVRPSGRPSGAPRPSFSPGAGGGFPGGGFGGGGGFNFTDPSTPPSGVDVSTWQKALNACKSVQPSFGGGGFGGGRNNSAFQAYRNCLSSHGVTFTSSTGPTGVNTSDPKVSAALKICEPLRPSGGPGAGPAPSPTS